MQWDARFLSRRHMTGVKMHGKDTEDPIVLAPYKGKEVTERIN